jgi:hypothetical protein
MHATKKRELEKKTQTPKIHVSGCKSKREEKAKG